MTHQNGHRPAQKPDTRDPAVAQFMAECGVVEHAINIRLLGVSRSDLETQIKRFTQLFAGRCEFTKPQPTHSGTAWIVWGTITS